jgi:putative oxidoreductase
MMYSALAPLAGSSDLVVLVVRIILGGVMVYYGWPKVQDPRKNADDFAKGGFTPGWLWGTIVMLVEFVGGLMIVVGFYGWVAASLIGIEMLTGTVWKITKAHKPFTDWSYDLLLLALALMLLVTGPGAYAVA